MVVSNYIENIRFITTLADAEGFVPLFYWQPDVTTKLRRTSWEDGQAKTLHPYMAALLHQARNHIAQCGNDLGSHFTNLDGVFDNHREQVYLDFCHLLEEGNAVIAVAMAKDVMARQ